MKLLSVFTAVVVVANAVPSTSAPSAASRSVGVLSRCILSCVIPVAVQNGCSDYTDLPCVCMILQSDTGACSHCTAADIQDAFRFQQGCSAAGLIPSSTFTPTPMPASSTIPSSPTAEKRDRCQWGLSPPDPDGPVQGEPGKCVDDGDGGGGGGGSDGFYSHTAGTVTTSAVGFTTTSAADSTSTADTSL